MHCNGDLWAPSRKHIRHFGQNPRSSNVAGPDIKASLSLGPAKLSLHSALAQVLEHLREPLVILQKLRNILYPQIARIFQIDVFLQRLLDLYGFASH